MEWLNFRHLYAFWMVARAGSFTRAASEMRVAQSAVSTQVAALEQYVGESLLVRSGRSFELTAAGRELLAHASSIFAQSRALNALIKDKDALGGQRRLRVGIVGGASRYFVYRLVSEYLAQSPCTRVSVSTGSYAELYGLLRTLELDAIVTLELPKKTDMGEVHYRKLGEAKLCIVGVPSLISAVRRRMAPKSIDVFKFRHPVEVNVLERYVRKQLGAEPILRLDTDDIPLLRFFANSGKGVSVLPRVGVLDDLEAGRVDAIELTGCPEVNIYGISMSQPLGGDSGLDRLAALWRYET